MVFFRALVIKTKQRLYYLIGFLQAAPVASTPLLFRKRERGRRGQVQDQGFLPRCLGRGGQRQGTGEVVAHRVETSLRGEKMPSGRLVSLLSYNDLGRGDGRKVGRQGGWKTHRRTRLDWSLKRSLGKQESAFLLSSLRRKVVGG